jgi:hypothetical protein
MGKMISILLGIFILIKGITWLKMGKTGVKTNYILGAMAIVVGILMLGLAMISFLQL